MLILAGIFLLFSWIFIAFLPIGLTAYIMWQVAQDRAPLKYIKNLGCCVKEGVSYFGKAK